jgi:malate dehydrogenase (oxaloacetate-decarboxylating)(NADP+)
MDLDENALDYHQREPSGKLEISPTKPTNTQRDLDLAYTPGVAAPCQEIADDADEAYRYTTKGDLVGVVSDGSATLGLGDIGAQAAKPVMEGKSVLFKRFADIDAFDIELDADDPDAVIQGVSLVAPTFGGINLEDISAPMCFEIEETLREELSIPVFHDDQHGTAVISGAALINAAELVEKELTEMRVVFAGAGAAATATAGFYTSLGVQHDSLIMCDADGILTEERADNGDLNDHNREFARDVEADDLAEAMEDADAFIGLSVGGIVSPEMVQSMADDPIVFAMANPKPEIGYEEAKSARDDTVIMATGRSDNPNQVNNALGFPYLFRGALDVRATTINEEMKITAANALADLARQETPAILANAYSDQPMQFGPAYVIPKPFDPRLVFEVAPAVAEAAIDSGAARSEVETDAYVERLEDRFREAHGMMQFVLNKAKNDPKRVALTDGANETILQAAAYLIDEGIAEPVLIGNQEHIAEQKDELDLEFDAEIVDPAASDLDEYADRLYELRQRNGVTRQDAEDRIHDSIYLGSIMVECGDADALLTGLTNQYSEALRPPLQVIGTAPDTDSVAGVYMLSFNNRTVFCADTTVNHNPDESVLVETTKHTTDLATQFNVEPRAALLSHSNFGADDSAGMQPSRRAARRLRNDPTIDFSVDGEMQADTAVVDDLLHGSYEFSTLDDPANVLVFPSLDAGNIGYKLLQRLGGAEAVGPMLVGMDEPVHVLQRDDEVKHVVDMASVAVVDAQREE